jgi:hypothetical protein
MDIDSSPVITIMKMTMIDVEKLAAGTHLYPYEKIK